MILSRGHYILKPHSRIHANSAILCMQRGAAKTETLERSRSGVWISTDWALLGKRQTVRSAGKRIELVGSPPNMPSDLVTSAGAGLVTWQNLLSPSRRGEDKTSFRIPAESASSSSLVDSSSTPEDEESNRERDSVQFDDISRLESSAFSALAHSDGERDSSRGGLNWQGEEEEKCDCGATAVLPFSDDEYLIKNCPGGHGLQEFFSAHSYICDGCNSILPSKSVVYGCRACDFDACQTCGSSDVKESAKSQMRCPNNHGMIDMKWQETRVCNVCSKHLHPGRKCFSCSSCDFDLCLRCSGLTEPTFYDILGLPCDATDEAIQRAAWLTAVQSRKQAVKTPRNGAARLEALAKYQDCANAYAILSDADSRKAYDSYLLNHPEGTGAFSRERFGSCHEGRDDITQVEEVSNMLRPPGWKRRQGKARVSHGLYVAVAGTIYAPAAASSYGVATIIGGLFEGVKCTGLSVANGGFSVATGISQLSNGKSLKGRRTKVHIGDHARFNRQSNRGPWSNIRKGLRQPVEGVAMSAAVVTACSVGGVCYAVVGSIYGVASNVTAGCSEIRDAIRHNSEEGGSR